MEDIYTSTGVKYARHNHIWQALREGQASPHTLQLNLSSKCNLDCTYCSIQNERKRRFPDWDVSILKSVLTSFIKRGVKAIEISGSGEPLMYPHFEDIVRYILSHDVEVSLITNGLLLHKVSLNILSRLSWIRISVQTDTFHKIEVPFLEKTTLGLSYVVSEPFENTRPFLEKLLYQYYVKNHFIRYIRIVPDCLMQDVKFEAVSMSYRGSLFEAFSPIMFFQKMKRPKQAKYCYMDAVKPWLHIDGYLYPCNGVSLNTKANRSFDQKYRVVNAIRGIDKYYDSRGDKSLDIANICDRCVFTENNKIIRSLVNPIQHENFI